MFICRVSLLLVVLILLASGVGQVEAVEVNSCTNITSSGTYTLTQDIVNSSALICINISASDVIFDGQGYTIDGTDSSDTSGIFVHSSGGVLNNVAIMNTIVTDWTYGIEYWKTTEGNITNNTLLSNDGESWSSGIFFQNSSNGNITNNNASGNSYGIWISNVSSTVLINNIASSNIRYGIPLSSGSYSNTLTNNTLSSNGYYGILIGALGSNNTITNNTVGFNTYGGIYLYNSANDDNTTILNNVLNSNGYGIILDNNNLTTIKGNTITNTTPGQGGIHIMDSTGAFIYDNFLNNSVNFEFMAGYNIYANDWNTSKTPGTNIIGGTYIGGNYWAYPNGTGFSETCTDSNSDWICDSSYTLTTGNIDYLPLSDYAISIIKPENTTLTDTSTYDDFNFTANNETDTMKYSLDGAANITNTTLNKTWTGTFIGLSDGQHNVTVWANDTSGNIATATRYWTRSTPSGGGSYQPPTSPPPGASPPPQEPPIDIPEPPFEDLPEGIICQVLINITTKRPFQDYLIDASRELIRELYLAKIITYSEAVNSLYFNYGYSTKIAMIQVGWWYIQRTLGVDSKITLKDYDKSSPEADFIIPITYGSSLECWLPETISASGITIISQNLNLTVDDLRERYMAGLITYTQSVNAMVDYNEYSYPLAMSTGLGWVIGKRIGITDRKADVLGIITIFIFTAVLIIALRRISEKQKRQINYLKRTKGSRGWFGERERHRKAYYKGRKS